MPPTNHTPMKIDQYVKTLSRRTHDEILADRAQLEKNGQIGDCTLRRVEREYRTIHMPWADPHTVLNMLNIASAVDRLRAENWVEIRAATEQLLEQVYQMEDMFPDDAALNNAIRDANIALYGASDREEMDEEDSP